jgi:hypothetical protein
VNPIHSFIIWTEYSTFSYSAIIRKSNSDGSNQQILVHENIRNPICIAIDYELELILWIDNELHSLSSIDYYGNNRQTIWQSKALFEDCSSMDIFGDYVYWSSPKNNKIIKISKFGANSEQTIVISDNEMNFVKIASPSRQQNATNYCSKSNCSHICLPSGKESYRCLCSAQKYWKLFLDDYECNEESAAFPAPVIPDSKSNTTGILELISSNEPLLLLSVEYRDIRIAKLPDNKSIFYMDTNPLHKIDSSSYVFAMDYNYLGNYLVWIKSRSVSYQTLYNTIYNTTLFSSPLNENQSNILQIEGKSLCLIKIQMQ